MNKFNLSETQPSKDTISEPISEHETSQETLERMKAINNKILAVKSELARRRLDAKKIDETELKDIIKFMITNHII